MLIFEAGWWVPEFIILFFFFWYICVCLNFCIIFRLFFKLYRVYLLILLWTKNPKFCKLKQLPLGIVHESKVRGVVLLIIGVKQLKNLLPIQKFLYTKYRKERKEYYYQISIKTRLRCTSGNWLKIFRRYKEISLFW